MQEVISEILAGVRSGHPNEALQTFMDVVRAGGDPRLIGDLLVLAAPEKVPTDQLRRFAAHRETLATWLHDVRIAMDVPSWGSHLHVAADVLKTLGHTGEATAVRVLANLVFRRIRSRSSDMLVERYACN